MEAPATLILKTTDTGTSDRRIEAARHETIYGAISDTYCYSGLGRPTFARAALEAVAQSREGRLSPAVSLAPSDDCSGWIGPGGGGAGIRAARLRRDER